MKKIVISGINLIDGGPLSIYTDFLDILVENSMYSLYDITILVGNKMLFQKYEDYFEIIEFSKSKKNWFYRMYYEYIYFWKFSKKLKPYLWISLHDITPNVCCENQVVYCHNPSISYKMTIKEILFEKKLFLFTMFYKYLYKINIKKNKYVIVQQQWMKKYFEEHYKISNVIVARPEIKISPELFEQVNSLEHKEYNFIFPAFPRVFKNFETICQACQRLENKKIEGYHVYLTIDGSENAYSKSLVDEYKHLQKIDFVGILERKELFHMYSQMDCLIFPSRLETWGLPITEFEILKKPVMAIDLPYAHETVGNYDQAVFFKNEKELADLMEQAVTGTNIFKKAKLEIDKNTVVVNNWLELFNYLVKDECDNSTKLQ